MNNKKAVMIGAGNIGRGFIGQIFHDSGYHVVFVDVDSGIVDKLNRDKSYLLTLTDGNNSETRIIDNVSALNGNNALSVAEQLAQCDIAAVAVGKKALNSISGYLALGIKERSKHRHNEPMNILICENINHARKYLYDLLEAHFLIEEKHLLNATGLVETTIGRMVPMPTPAMRAADITAIATEPYYRLPVDEKAFRGIKPELLYTETFDPFEFFEEKKLFIHNLGHAMCAFMGARRGYEYVWQAVSDEEVAGAARNVMNLLAGAIANTYNADKIALFEFVDELLRRFGNRLLGDTVARVGRDPLRKLAPGDRFMGAVARCQSQGLLYDELLTGIAAALKFNADGDPTAGQMHEMIALQGVEGFAGSYCGLSEKDSHTVASIYNRDSK